MLGAIWAQSRDGLIGDGHSMPWHVPEDLAHFKAVTIGSPVIMGSRTWESLFVRPLPGRENFVLSSRAPGPWSEGATVVKHVPSSGWIIGGGKVYADTISLVDRIEITLIDGSFTVPTPVFAPSVPSGFDEVDRSEWLTSKTGTRYQFVSFVRNQVS